MTHYLVKHGAEDVRLHGEDGTERLSTRWETKPSANEIASAIAAEAPGGSLWGNDDYRGAVVDVLSGGLRWRDLTRERSAVPWE